MPGIQVSTVIDVPPVQVWNAVADISTHVRWMADAESITFTSPRTSGVGTTFDCATRVGPISLVDSMAITRWDEPCAMGVTHVGVVTGTGEFTLRSSGPGGRRTEFAWAERLRFPWWLGGPVGALMAKPVLQRIWRGNLNRLRQLVESESRR